MACSCGLAFLMVLVAPSTAGRVQQNGALVHEVSDSEASDGPNVRLGNLVDFSFMTKERRLPTPADKGAVLGRLKRPTEAEAGNNEDIVVGHTCAKKGEPAQTYYASSMCYWLPQATTSRSGMSAAASLTWAPGKLPWNPSGAEMSLCGNKLTGQGECVKCSICHDGRMKLGQTSFVEKLPLPAGCFKEPEIVSACTGNYETGMQDKKTTIARCDAAKQHNGDMIAAVKSATLETKRLTDQEADFTGRVSEKTNAVATLEGEERFALDKESDAVVKLGDACVELDRDSGPLPFRAYIARNASAAEVLAQAAFECGTPVEPAMPIPPSAPAKPMEPRFVSVPGPGQPSCQKEHPSLRQAKVLRKVTLSSSASNLDGLEFIERDGPEFRSKDFETYWTEKGDYVIHRCTSRKWVLNSAEDWPQIKAEPTCKKAVAIYPVDVDILYPTKFERASQGVEVSVARAGTAGPLANTITIGGLPSRLQQLNGRYAERRDLVFQVNGRETYWGESGQGLVLWCQKLGAWVLTDSDLKAAQADPKCNARDTFTEAIDILSTWGDGLAQLTRNKGAGVVALGTMEQCVFGGKLYAAPGSGGYLGTAVSQEPDLESCLRRCTAAEACAYVTHWSNGTCYLQREGALLWEPAGAVGSVFPTAAAKRCGGANVTTTSKSLLTGRSGRLDPDYGKVRTCKDWSTAVATYKKQEDAEAYRYIAETAIYERDIVPYEQVALPAHEEAMRVYRNALAVARGQPLGACRRCREAKTVLVEKHSSVLQVERALAQERTNLADAEAKLARAKSDLADSAAFKATKITQQLEAELAVREKTQECDDAEKTYAESRKPFMAKCIPTFYDRSCEKACITAQAQNGCAVIEGTSTAPSDAGSPSKGKVPLNVNCAPPQPSWVLAPLEYDASAKDDSQCARIEASQHAQYAQLIVKSGYLFKQSRTGSWDKRFFMLESGDQVRTARLKYVEVSDNEVKESAEAKDINLWHAKGVTKKEYQIPHELYENYCFKIYGSSRDHRFCSLSSGSRGAREIDEWVYLLRTVINKE